MTRELKRDRATYVCEDCGRSFYTADGLSFHTNRLHGENGDD